MNEDLESVKIPIEEPPESRPTRRRRRPRAPIQVRAGRSSYYGDSVVQSGPLLILDSGDRRTYINLAEFPVVEIRGKGASRFEIPAATSTDGPMVAVPQEAGGVLHLRKVRDMNAQRNKQLEGMMGQPFGGEA